MQGIHRSCWHTAEELGARSNYIVGANVAGFLRVAKAMIAQGLI